MDRRKQTRKPHLPRCLKTHIRPLEEYTKWQLLRAIIVIYKEMERPYQERRLHIDALRCRYIRITKYVSDHYGYCYPPTKAELVDISKQLKARHEARQAAKQGALT